MFLDLLVYSGIMILCLLSVPAVFRPFVRDPEMIREIQLTTFVTIVLMVLVSLIMAALYAKGNSRTLAKITQQAKLLAEADYDLELPENRIREYDELCNALNYASAELKKTEQLQRELVSNVSHDLRTPLTMIRGYAEMMRDIPGENTPENLQVIIDETVALNELVTDILDLSRIEAGVAVPERKVHCLTVSIESMIERYRKLLEPEGFTIEFNKDEPAFINADPAMLWQIISNLINNAVNHSTDVKKIEIEQKTEDGTVTVVVRDHGAGIPESELAMIWDRYYKSNTAREKLRMGTGLGLSIVKRTLELQQAEYGVESTVGKGSAFWFKMAVVPQYKKEV